MVKGLLHRQPIFIYDIINISIFQNYNTSYTVFGDICVQQQTVPSYKYWCLHILKGWIMQI